MSPHTDGLIWVGSERCFLAVPAGSHDAHPVWRCTSLIDADTESLTKRLKTAIDAAEWPHSRKRVRILASSWLAPVAIVDLGAQPLPVKVRQVHLEDSLLSTFGLDRTDYDIGFDQLRFIGKSLVVGFPKVPIAAIQTVCVACGLTVVEVAPVLTWSWATFRSLTFQNGWFVVQDLDGTQVVLVKDGLPDSVDWFPCRVEEDSVPLLVGRTAWRLGLDAELPILRVSLRTTAGGDENLDGHCPFKLRNDRDHDVVTHEAT